MVLQPEVAMARALGAVLLYYSLFGDKTFPYLQYITHQHQPPLLGKLGDWHYSMNSLCTTAE
jgi:hypothetical protein